MKTLNIQVRLTFLLNVILLIRQCTSTEELQSNPVAANFSKTLPVAETKYGRLRGTVLDLLSNARVVAFLDVPYAEPPVGLRRFKAPVRKDPWTGILSATEFGPLCIQHNRFKIKDLINNKKQSKLINVLPPNQYRQSEDCLSLNIYIPESVFEGVKYSKRSTQTIPVMVYLHGGSNEVSGGRFYPGEWLSSAGGVVVVTMNYRLGPLGFLSTRDRYSPGNYGMFDQVLALKWIQENIQAFGGNPEKVTIFGNGVGSAFVSLHMVSPLSKGLFAAAIAQSGSSVARWAVQRDPFRYATRLARSVDCPKSANTKHLMRCLRRVSASSLARTTRMADALGISFAPVVDGYFLPDYPENLIQQGRYNMVPFMTGFTKDEVSIWMELYEDPTKTKLKEYLKNLLVPKVNNLDNMEALVHAVYTEYVTRGRQPNGLNDSILNATADDIPIDIHILTQILGDAGFKVPCMRHVQLLADHHNMPVYLYEFTYSSSDDWISRDQPWLGAYHESEMYYILGYPQMTIKNAYRTPEDHAVSDMLVKLWSNFAKHGNPTPKEQLNQNNFTWKPYTRDEPVYADLGEQAILRKTDHLGNMNFWINFVPLFTDYPMNNDERIQCNRTVFVITSSFLGLTSFLCITLILYACIQRRHQPGIVLKDPPSYL
ncbi:pyrethroid hydrolase Ces2e-like [Limulus polyphemus]|uniref:Pyrethroid hydrolase Ces2e-like n=1 Tax=Limulus polyphemus TaxID=6850 RepID=A0ABM1BKD2_LIMPO|nr:pyrethroid hydrolase Ces2e-like [Limulus polyphemus]